jgi:hypothetical protein
MLEPENNPTASYFVDPPRLLRFFLSKTPNGERKSDWPPRGNARPRGDLT